MDSLSPRDQPGEPPIQSPPTSKTLIAETVSLQQWDRRSVIRRWVLTLVTLVATLLLAILAYPNDMEISAWIVQAGQLPGDLRRVLALSELVAHGSGIFIIVVVLWKICPRLRVHLPRVACCAFTAGLVANAVKLLHARIRPLACPPDIETVQRTWQGWFPVGSDNFSMQYGYAYQSFPSAHTATAVGFSIGLAWLFPKGRAVFFTMAILAGLQRIAFLAHWPTDVLLGASIGVVMGSCFTLPGTLGNYLFNRFERYQMFAGKTEIQTSPANIEKPSGDLIEPDPARERRAA